MSRWKKDRWIVGVAFATYICIYLMYALYCTLHVPMVYSKRCWPFRQYNHLPKVPRSHAPCFRFYFRHLPARPFIVLPYCTVCLIQYIRTYPRNGTESPIPSWLNHQCSRDCRSALRVTTSFDPTTTVRVLILWLGLLLSEAERSFCI